MPGGGLVQSAKVSRGTRPRVFAAATPTVIGVEACAGSQWLARKHIELGHDARIIPARFVKPCVTSNGTDLTDGEAMAEAAIRPTMRFVEVRSADQVDLRALHRIGDRLIRNPSGPMNPARACLASNAGSR
jgi:transposase